MANLNPVETTVTVAGTKVHFIRLQLNQAFNAHHTFRIEVDFEEFGGNWMDDPTKLINYIGEEVTITMKHKDTGEQNLFSGIITNVSMSGYHGQQNVIVVTGCSPTIKLAGKPAMDSFMDLPLQQIVDEAVGNSGNGCAVTANPVFGSTLDYICQYDENCFDFLNRLSWEFGEWFYYDGTTCYFGKKEGEGSTVEYDKEMTYFDLSANLTPGKFNRYHYLVHDDKEIDKDDPSSVPGVRGYLEVSKGRSESVYTSEANIPLGALVNTKKDLDDLVKAEKSRAVSEMLVIKGATQTCKIKIGAPITIKLPDTMDVAAKSVDTFVITQVTHEIDQKGHYSNSFSGVMSGLEVIPMAQPPLPLAQPQIASVKTNDDEKKLGRVKVEFQWQKKAGKTTNWIRVQATDAGKSDKVPNNRGLVTIPEKDDIVMVGFEYGDPNRPFVMGSIFSEKVSQGGKDNNKIKSYTTRVDSSVTFDDEKGSITIKDQQGSDSTLTFDGEKNIVMAAGESITLVCGKSIIVLEKDGTITINGTKIYNAASEEINISTGDLEGGNYSGISVEPDNVGITAIKDIVEVSKNVTLGSGGNGIIAMDEKGEITVNGTKINLN